MCAKGKWTGLGKLSCNGLIARVRYDVCGGFISTSWDLRCWRCCPSRVRGSLCPGGHEKLETRN